MRCIECTFLSDGSFDAALIPILQWVMEEQLGIGSTRFAWADLQRLPHPPRLLVERMVAAVTLYPCQILFVHRDAENQPAVKRYEEVQGAMESVRQKGHKLPHVCVVPVRMSEAWLLLDEQSIRLAAGNPGGTMSLEMPAYDRIEAMADPKVVLHSLLRTASGLRHRRLKHFRPHREARLIPQYMADFSCLRVLSAFVKLEEDVRQVANSFLSEDDASC